jgi:hypothetical protein
MRNPANVFLLFAVLTFSFACSDENTEVAPADTNSITIKIDGTVWTPAIVTAYYSEQSGITLITGSNASATQQLKIAFMGNEAGTYTFTAADQNTFGTFIVTGASAFIFSTLTLDNPVGHITVSGYDKTKHIISGTFYFEGYSGSVKKTFSEGVFTKVEYDAY